MRPSRDTHEIYAQSLSESARMTEEQMIMVREIALQPEFVRANIDAMMQSARASLAARPIGRVSNAFVIGCGDSFCAALAARQYMMAQTKRWIEPVEALEFSRYLVSSLPADSIVFGVSNSGTVARTIEGVKLAREHGAWTFAVTAGAHNELAATAQTLIEVNAVPNIKVRPDGTKLVTPGTITYTASLLGLFVGAVALGEWLGSLSPTQTDASVNELRRLGEWMAAAENTVATSIEQLVATFEPQRRIVILGGGPNYATAYYGMAKLIEAVQWPAHHAQTEEWAHEHYFVTGSTTDTIIIAAPGGARDRGLEQVRAAREMGSRTIVLGAESDAVARAAADAFVALPDDVPEALTPLVYKLPFEYLACGLAQRFGTRFFNFDDPLRQAVNFRQIFAPR